MVFDGCVITLADLWVCSPRRTLTYWLTQATLLVLALWQAQYAVSLWQPDASKVAYGFGNMVLADALGSWLKCMATLALLFTLVYARPYAAQRNMLQRGGELFTLSLFGLLGGVHHGFGQPFPADLSRPGSDEFGQFCPGGLVA